MPQIVAPPPMPSSSTECLLAASQSSNQTQATAMKDKKVLNVKKRSSSSSSGSGSATEANSPTTGGPSSPVAPSSTFPAAPGDTDPADPDAAAPHAANHDQDAAEPRVHTHRKRLRPRPPTALDIAAELNSLAAATATEPQPFVNRFHRALWGGHEPRWARRAHNGVMGAFGDKYIIRD